nr:hypothetical protein [Sinorhizobium meliloti]
MYAAAQAKPQSIEAEHLGPAALSGPRLVGTYKAGREIYAQGDLNHKCYPKESHGSSAPFKLPRDCPGFRS